jgi:hypothetical protein
LLCTGRWEVILDVETDEAGLSLECFEGLVSEVPLFDDVGKFHHPDVANEDVIVGTIFAQQKTVI